MEQIIETIDPKKRDYYYEEAMKTLRTNIQLTGREIKSILFTSCLPNEGKSDVSFQLAREIGKMGKRVLLLDADIRRSTYVSRYHINQKINGLSQYLSGQAEKEHLRYATNFENVDIIFAGPVAPNPSELLEEKDFEKLLKEMRAAYDYVLVDTPPLGSVIDAAIIAKHCDGAVLIVESERVSYRLVQKAKAQLEKTGCKILGAVLNKVDMKKDKYYNRYQGYYYYYGSRKK